MVAASNAIIVPAAPADLLIVAAAVYDWRTRGRPHRIYVTGGLCTFGTQLLRQLSTTTGAWQAAMAALGALTSPITASRGATDRRSP